MSNSLATNSVNVTAQEVKASGIIVQVEPDHFLNILARAGNPLVITGQSGYRPPRYHYLMEYKGVVFLTEAFAPLQLADTIEVITAAKVSLPA